MDRNTKTWLIIGAVLVIGGLILFTAVMMHNQWNFTGLNTEEFETHTYAVEEEFCNISVKTDTIDISVAPSEEDGCKVVAAGPEYIAFTVKVQDDTLVIRCEDNRQWHERIGIFFETPKITVYLPETQYASLRVEESTGDVEIPDDFTFESIAIATSTGDVMLQASASEGIQIATSTGDILVKDLRTGTLQLALSTGDVIAKSITCEENIAISVSTGDVNLTDVTCERFTSSGSTGCITMQNLIAADRMDIDRSTGDVLFEGCDAGEILVETDTGDVIGTLLSDKVFITNTNTGDVVVPRTSSGGICEITTTTGDIFITLEK